MQLSDINTIHSTGDHAECLICFNELYRALAARLNSYYRNAEKKNNVINLGFGNHCYNIK